MAGIDAPAERLVAFVRFFEDGADDLMSEQSGCLYATVLAERELTGHEINDLVAAATVTWRRAVAELVTALDACEPGLRDDIDVDDLADHLYTTFEGAFILCRTPERFLGDAIAAPRAPATARGTAPRRLTFVGAARVDALVKRGQVAT